MNKIGLDFGTTNSTLSYFDKKEMVFKTYQMNIAEAQTDYIPSSVSYEIGGNEICIGHASRLCQGEPNYETYSRFKILLGEKDKDLLRDNNYGIKKPKDVAQTYLHELLKSYREKYEEQIEGIVITVPEIWAKEKEMHLARENLKKICEELELPLKKFLSEPVAAAVYYLYKRQEKKENDPFDGHILVCDCGGGTLDLSLCRAEERKSKITVLERTGKGSASETEKPDGIQKSATKSLGKAGVAFDDKVIMNIYQKIRNTRLQRTDNLYHKLMDQFESRKIIRQKRIDVMLEQYIKEKTLDGGIFHLLDNELEVKPSDLYEAFEEEIKPELKSALEEMKSFMSKEQIDWQDKKKFRLLMVGGFSNFALVKRTVMECFNLASTRDERFDSMFTIDDIALAISKGAAAVANDLYQIETACPISVGITLRNTSQSPAEPSEYVDKTILAKGEIISKYEKAVYPAPSRFYDFHKDLYSEKRKVIIFLGDGKERTYLDLAKEFGKNIDQLFPKFKKYGNKWRIGFSVDENLIFSLHIQDHDGSEEKTDLGDLMDKISLLKISHEDK